MLSDLLQKENIGTKSCVLEEMLSVVLLVPAVP